MELHPQEIVVAQRNELGLIAASPELLLLDRQLVVLGPEAKPYLEALNAQFLRQKQALIS